MVEGKSRNEKGREGEAEEEERNIDNERREVERKVGR